MRKIFTLGFALAVCASALFADDPKKAADDMVVDRLLRQRLGAT